MNQAIVQGSGFTGATVIDSNAQMIFTYDANGNQVFAMDTMGGCGFDVWKNPDGSFVYCHLGPDGHHGVRLVTPENEVLTAYASQNEIFCCQPLEGGYLLAGELTQKRIAIAGPNGKLEQIIPIQSEISGHEVMRSARYLGNERYMVVHPGDKAIRQYDGQGHVTLELATRNDTFAALELENGNILYTAQTAVVELNRATGKEVWSFGKEDAPELGIHWLTGMQRLADGSIALVNWLGHGMEHTGVPVFAIDAGHKLLWTLTTPENTQAPAHLQIGDRSGR